MAVKTFLLKNSAASGSSHGSLQDGSTVTTATTTTGFRVGTTAATNYALQVYNSIVTTFTGTALPSTSPSTTDSWRSESPLTGTFANGSWSIALSVISSVANSTGSGRLRVRIWKSTNANGSSATELTTSTVTTTQWSNVTTSTAQNLTATATIAQTDFNNEYLFIQTAIQIDTVGANSTSEIRYRIDGTNSKITTTQFNVAFSGGELSTVFSSSPIDTEGTAAYSGGELNFEFFSSPIDTEGTASYNGGEANTDTYFSSIRLAGNAGYELSSEGVYNSPKADENTAFLDGSYQTSTGSPTGVSLTTYYAMRAVDPDCPTLTYVSWVVQDNPDLTGSLYAGPRCGASPLTAITVVHSWKAAA